MLFVLLMCQDFIHTYDIKMRKMFHYQSVSRSAPVFVSPSFHPQNINCHSQVLVAGLLSVTCNWVIQRSVINKKPPGRDHGTEWKWKCIKDIDSASLKLTHK